MLIHPRSTREQVSIKSTGRAVRNSFGTAWLAPRFPQDRPRALERALRHQQIRSRERAVAGRSELSEASVLSLEQRRDARGLEQILGQIRFGGIGRGEKKIEVAADRTHGTPRRRGAAPSPCRILLAPLTFPPRFPGIPSEDRSLHQA